MDGSFIDRDNDWKRLGAESKCSILDSMPSVKYLLDFQIKMLHLDFYGKVRTGNVDLAVTSVETVFEAEGLDEVTYG